MANATSGKQEGFIGPISSQWRNPGNILDLLLLVGGDVIKTALAQMTGDCWSTPVVFSFGWVAYAFTALSSIVRDNRLLLASDQPSVLINGKTGYSRFNQSWILGRILRDYESGHWMYEWVRQRLDQMLKVEGREKAGICVSFFDATGSRTMEEKFDPMKSGEPAIEPERDMLWIAGYLVAVIQLCVAAIPCILWKEWDTLVITICGTALSFFTASLPQWRQERWACRTLTTEKTFILTRGNGAQHALVIFGRPGSLNLEDLASSTEPKQATTSTKLMMAGLLALWVVLLVTVSGLEIHTWFVMAVGGLGMLYSVVVAFAPRCPENFGIRLQMRRLSGLPEVIVENKVMMGLFKAEMAYPGLGRSMLATFFPAELSAGEQIFWDKAKEFEGAQPLKAGFPKIEEAAKDYAMKLEKAMKVGSLGGSSKDVSMVGSSKDLSMGGSSKDLSIGSSSIDWKKEDFSIPR